MGRTRIESVRWWSDDFLSLLSDWGSALRASDPAIKIIDGALAAKGGIPGPPSNPGGGDGEGDSGVLKDYFSGSYNGDAGYDIWIEFKGNLWEAKYQVAFIQAANYFTTDGALATLGYQPVITDDIGGPARYRGKIIDDLYVTAELKVIDGPGGILGRAGPTALWTSNDLTAAGVMEFDIDDVAFFYDLGLWNDIVMHELMHVLGFGTLWNYGRHNLIDGYKYIGKEALKAYNEWFNTNVEYIPVEDDGGSGTAGGHWDEDVLGNELMTGWINNNNYLSKFSIMSLADLGYVVDYQDYPYDDVLIA